MTHAAIMQEWVEHLWFLLDRTGSGLTGPPLERPKQKRFTRTWQLLTVMKGTVWASVLSQDCLWPLRQHPKCVGQNTFKRNFTICNNSIGLFTLADFSQTGAFLTLKLLFDINCKRELLQQHLNHFSPQQPKVDWFCCHGNSPCVWWHTFYRNPRPGISEWSQRPFCPVRNLEFITVLAYLTTIYSTGAILPVITAQPYAAQPTQCGRDNIRVSAIPQGWDTEWRELNERVCCLELTTNYRLHLQDLKAESIKVYGQFMRITLTLKDLMCIITMTSRRFIHTTFLWPTNNQILFKWTVGLAHPS